MESETLDFFQGKISDNSTVPVNVSSLIVNKIRYKRIQAPGGWIFLVFHVFEHARIHFYHSMIECASRMQFRCLQQ